MRTVTRTLWLFTLAFQHVRESPQTFCSLKKRSTCIPNSRATFRSSSFSPCFFWLPTPSKNWGPRVLVGGGSGALPAGATPAEPPVPGVPGGPQTGPGGLGGPVPGPGGGRDVGSWGWGVMAPHRFVWDLPHVEQCDPNPPTR